MTIRFPFDNNPSYAQYKLYLAGYGKSIKGIRRRVAQQRLALWARDSNIIREGVMYADCRYCGAEYRLHDMTRDHVIPLGKGGKNSIENIVLACNQCNNKKADRMLANPFSWNKLDK
jgi:5-methylcytosine-specific restriction endonuclease McrA